MQIVKKLGLLLTLSLALVVGACNNEGGVETESPGEQIEEGAEGIGDGIEEGAENLGEDMEEGAEDLEESVEGEN